MQQIQQYRRTLYAALLLCLAATSHGEQEAVTADGERVMLSEDGTWRCAEAVDQDSDGQEIASLIRAYLSATQWRDKLAYVLDPERVAPCMQAEYEKRPPPNLAEAKILTHSVGEVSLGEYVTVPVEVRGLTVSVPVLKTKDGFKIHWESASGIPCNETSIRTFRAMMPRDPVTVRVTAELSDYYNYEFAESADEYLSVSCSDRTASIHGYVKRSSSLAREMTARLSDGQKHRIVAVLEYSPAAREPSVCLLSRILAYDTWIVK